MKYCQVRKAFDELKLDRHVCHISLPPRTKPNPREARVNTSLFSNEDSIDKIVEYIESSEKEVNTKRKKKKGTQRVGAKQTEKPETLDINQVTQCF